MSDIDLTEAIEAGVNAFYDAAGVRFDSLDPHDASMARHSMYAAIAAAAPIIEDQVREQIARAIEAYADATWDLVDSNNGARIAFETIASIARGVTS